MQFVADLGRNEDGSLQIMYGIDGEQDLTERTLDHLHGYEGARPGAGRQRRLHQRQNDVYGAVLDSVYLHTKASGYIPERLWPVLEAQVEAAIAGLAASPTRGSGRRAASPSTTSPPSSCAGWRWTAARGWPHVRGDEEAEKRWAKVADEIRADILEHGVRDGIFRQHYDTDALDASVLLVPLVRFLPDDDERVRATVLAIARRPDRARPRAPLQGRRDRRRAARQGGHVRHLLVLARQRRCRRSASAHKASELCEQAAQLRLPRCSSTPRRSTPTPAATWATTRRRSPTWRSSTRSCTSSQTKTALDRVARPASLQGGRLGLFQRRPRGLRLHRKAVRGPRGRRRSSAPKFRKANTIVQYQYRNPESQITVKMLEGEDEPRSTSVRPTWSPRSS